jgi:hypothetical protein
VVVFSVGVSGLKGNQGSLESTSVVMRWVGLSFGLRWDTRVVHKTVPVVILA